MTARLDRPILYKAAKDLLEKVLGAGSVFTPGRAVWTEPHLTELRTRVIDKPDTSGDSFEEKLKHQLKGGNRDVVQLGGEAFFVFFLKDSVTPAEVKRAEIETVLSESPETIPLPQEAVDALKVGIANPGQANLHKWPQYGYIIDFSLAWIALGEQDRSACLNDPWVFKEFVFSVPGTGAPAQQEAMLHLVHPDTFEPIIARRHKRLVARAFADRLPEAVTIDDIDRQILLIREALEQDPKFGGAGYVWYSPAIRPMWDVKKQDVPIHLLLRWSATFNPKTIDLHKEVAEEKGSVWWGKRGDPVGKSAMSARRLTRIQEQLATDTPTHVYLYRQGDLWRTDLVQSRFGIQTSGAPSRTWGSA